MTDLTQEAEKLHPSVREVLQHFEIDHLPEDLRAVSGNFYQLAWILATTLKGPELTVGLRKLLEAKDCAVRAKVAMNRGI